MTALPRIAEIKRVVAERYRVPLRIMSEPNIIGSRPLRHVRPRQIGMLLAVRLTNHSYARIGHFFGGRDHATVMHACKAVEKRRVKNPRLGVSLRQMTFELVGQ